MRKNRIYTDIELNSLHSTGRCQGYIGNRRIYVDLGIPCEIIDTGKVRHEGDYFRGTVIGVKNPHPGRTDPFCKHFGLCGGCNWQHISYPEQLKWKKQLLSDALDKYGIRHPELPLPVASPQCTHYRYRLDYSFSTRRWYHEGEGKVEHSRDRLALGFHPVDLPHKVLDIEECYLQDAPGRKIYEKVKEVTLKNEIPYFDPKEKQGLLRSLSIRINRKGEAQVVLGMNEYQPETAKFILSDLQQQVPEAVSLWFSHLVQTSESWVDEVYYPFSSTTEYLFEEANGIRFRISPGSFYQPNPAQAERIFAEIVSIAALEGRETIYDLYSGIGTIGLNLAANAATVIGIEGSESAVEDARWNATAYGLTNCQFIHGDVLRTFTPEFVEKHGFPDVVVLDPPRSGTLIEIKKTILSSAPKKIIYLSCNPLSLAFDLKMLTERYRITYIQPFDQFPHTHHLETLVMLEKEQDCQSEITP